MSAYIQSFIDPKTNTISYIVYGENKQCAVIDPVLNYDFAFARTSTEAADSIIEYIHKENLTLLWILETHLHGDHLSASNYLKKQLGGKTGISTYLSQIYHLGINFRTDGSQFDHLFTDGELFQIGSLKAKAIHTPGHTPACMTYYLIEEGIAFVGDTLLMPDYGTGRTDLFGGDAHILYQSIQKIYQLPNEIRLFSCHDYPPNSRNLCWESTVADQKYHNPIARQGISEIEFVEKRKAKEQNLPNPSQILPALQVNISAGELPLPESNNITYLKIPLNQF
ncbi:MBL fold metallo-hydrolase [Candidatus Nitrosacidococcus sp. I8]|uniref:MBL fold metallo-hydrolase n=1 Tax=Candidatus Nitrosacidococcus sp. I8 TaxID=2942908 RepID=UPI0022262C65|nr:MBL fold metallo-hydrolase [Candidatus Nitrosacidococcus sp. I8]CAH9018567.1 putative metallo-hydrolase [Candidatus Nitrosacidococcus sp. I8]